MNELVSLYRVIPGKMLTLDITGSCNLKCQMCVWHNGKMQNAPKQHLDFALFKKTIEELLVQSIKFECINLSVSGEPLLHPEFRLIFSTLFGSNEYKCLFDTLSINTNMAALTPKLTDWIFSELTDYGYQGNLFLTCSLNSASAEVGTLVKGKDLHEIIEKNTRYLLEQKAARPDLHDRLKIDLQCLVLKENEHEIGTFVQKWSKRLDRLGLPYKVVPDVFDECGTTINIKREFDHERQAECDARFHRAAEAVGLHKRGISQPFYSEKPVNAEPARMAESPGADFAEGPSPMGFSTLVPELAADSGAVTAAPAPAAFKELRQPCHALWLTPIIRSDGEVSVCLSDIDGHMRLGNLKDGSFLSIWLGDAANKFRIWHAKNKASNIAVCSHCTYYEANQVENQYWERFRTLVEDDFSQASELDRKIRRFNAIPDKILTLDLTNLCNLSCYYCTFTQEEKHMAKPKKHMSLQEIKKVCNEFVMHNTFFETICLSVSGEPMFNPEFSQIVQYLFEINTTSKRLFRNLSINTNATFLTEERTNMMCHFVERGYGYIQLTLSINAASRESFIKTKKVDLFDRTVKNTRYLLKEKARRKVRYSLTTYLLFLVNEEVEHEAEAFRDFWVKEVEELGEKYQVDYALPTREHVVIIFKRTYANEGLFKINQAGYDEMHRRVAQRLGLMPEEKAGDQNKNVPIFTPDPGKICGSPWLSPIIRHDGTLNFCLTDVDNHMPVGNVFKDSFFDLWFSKEAEEFRARLAQQKFGDHDLCKNCNYFDGVKIPDVTAQEYRSRELPAAASAPWQKQPGSAPHAISCH